MNSDISFIEQQFPVSKISKESYKERKSSQGQTITGLGKWWGRKPLILVRAAIIGCLLPTSNNPRKDTEIFLKILSMDKDGLIDRKNKKIPPAKLYDIANRSKYFKKYIDEWFTLESGKPAFREGADIYNIELRLFNSLGYDEKIEYCCRPEHLANIRESSWHEINEHLGTTANSLNELINQLSVKRFGKLITVGDCFSGGGSIPFEAARIGANIYGSDLNPISGMLTWADLHICGASNDDIKRIESFLESAYNDINKEICQLGIEHNENGDRALSYLYCIETNCPECGWKIPLLPNLTVGIRAGRVIAELKEREGEYDILIHNNVSASQLSAAQRNGTCRNNSLICPHCGKTTPISSIRHDLVDDNGKTIYGLRKWKKEEFDFLETDVFHERLYAIRYERKVISQGKEQRTRYYTAPSNRDLDNERRVNSIVRENFTQWQEKGFIPSNPIESGAKTDEVIKTRGWTYWHQLFNARQLFILSRMAEKIERVDGQLEKVAGILALNKCADFNSKLCRWNPNCDKSEQTFYNQALNTLMNYGTRSLTMISTLWFRLSQSEIPVNDSTVLLTDAREVQNECDFWITDPPYADAVNYHELSEFFLAWDKTLIKKAFPEWYTDSKRILAVRGDEHFSETMIEIYSNLVNHMPDNGMQIVMFTHSNPAIWAQLALIMWKSGLKVTAAWNVATETDASGLKSGNYIKGTVLLVLRKQTGDDEAFLDEISSDIRSEVRKQIDSMLALDDKEDPNFSDPDMVLAAYAASLKVLTSYAEIEDLDLDYELSLAINNPTQSQIVKIIENAKKIAYDCVIPAEFDNMLWKDLSSAEKFYIKGLETEKHNNYQISTYQEFARGFSVGGYSQLMAVEKANNARLKTPYEMASRTMNDVPDFENSIMRTVFKGVFVGIKEDENPNQALGYIKNEIPNYWEKREMIKQILTYIMNTKDIANMAKHWTESAQMAELLYSLVDNDSI